MTAWLVPGGAGGFYSESFTATEKESEALSQGNARDEVETCTELGSVKHTGSESGHLVICGCSQVLIPSVCSMLRGSREGRNTPAASLVLCPRRPGCTGALRAPDIPSLPRKPMGLEEAELWDQLRW